MHVFSNIFTDFVCLSRRCSQIMEHRCLYISQIFPWSDDNNYFESANILWKCYIKKGCNIFVLRTKGDYWNGRRMNDLVVVSLPYMSQPQFIRTNGIYDKWCGGQKSWAPWHPLFKRAEPLDSHVLQSPNFIITRTKLKKNETGISRYHLHHRIQ